MFGHLKNLVIPTLFPVPLCLGTFLIGLIFLWLTKKQKIGKIIITVGCLLLLLFSLPFLPNLILGHLEQKYVPFNMESNEEYKSSEIRYIVVLAGGHVLDPRLPITGQFSPPGLVRLIEGVRLYKKYRGAQLILSGGIGTDPVPDAELMADLAVALGIPEDDIILESKSMNTYEEAKFINPIVKDQKFILVTSASHMPRSMALFRKQGMNPIPAPTGHLVKHHENKNSILPSSFELMKSYIMIYEFLGLAKEKLLGRI